MNKKIFRIFLIIGIFLTSVTFINFDIFEKEKEISVTVDDKQYAVPLGTTYDDLKIDDDNSSLSDDYVLYDKQIIKTNVFDETRISLNKADSEKLMELPGIGEKTALKIIEYREKYGGFKSIEEIKNVSGIGEKKYAKIKDLITV